MNVINYHIVLTVVFFIAFIAMVVWVYAPGRGKKYEDIARQPLEDDLNRAGESRHE